MLGSPWLFSSSSLPPFIYFIANNQISSTCLAQEINLQRRLQEGPGGSPYSTVYQCRKCRRFQQSEKHYVPAEPESQQLLAICLKSVPALSSSSSSPGGDHHNVSNPHRDGVGKVHLIDAGWIWTEPHSMRLKLRLTVRTEVHGVQVQQRCLIEQRVQFKMCPDCNREYTNRTWQAVVQLRQHRENVSNNSNNSNNDGNAGQAKKGLTSIEMALSKNKEARKNVLRIDSAKSGFDFYFLLLRDAQSFAQFLQRLAPMRVKTSRKLVSTDVKNNTANVKYAVACDVVPFCKDDLVVVDKKAKKGSLSGRLVLVTKVSSVIHFVDASPSPIIVSTTAAVPKTNDDSSIVSSNNNNHTNGNSIVPMMELSPETYYKNEKLYEIVPCRFVRFVVLDVELLSSSRSSTSGSSGDDDALLYRGPASGVEKYALADVEVARESDFGANDDTFRCVTHLGHLLQPGDVVLGYDLSADTGRGDDFFEDRLKSGYVVPDVVLVKKVKGDADNNLDDAVTVGEAHGGDDAVADEADGDGKSRLSKKQQRRRRNKEGRRTRELEESAVRMGFFEDDDQDEVDGDYLDEDDGRVDRGSGTAATVDAGGDGEDDVPAGGGRMRESRQQQQQLLLSDDPELEADVAALDRDFGSMGRSNE